MFSFSAKYTKTIQHTNDLKVPGLNPATVYSTDVRILHPVKHDLKYTAKIDGRTLNKVKNKTKLKLKLKLIVAVREIILLALFLLLLSIVFSQLKLF